MRPVAVLMSGQFGRQSPIDGDGNVLGSESSAVLLRRVLRMFPGVQLVRPGPVELFDWGSAVPLSAVDVNRTVLISFNTLDSPLVYGQMKHTQRFHWPKIVNFAWWNVSDFDPIAQAQMALSCSLFPTFANSRKQVSEIKDAIRLRVGAEALKRLNVDWAFLGVDTTLIPTEREPGPVPTVWYPAVFLNTNKQAERWLQIMGKVAARTPLVGVARVHEKSQTGPVWEAMKDARWMHVGDVVPDKQAYYDAMRGMDVFLATAREESYGLAYLEALCAGMVGVFPDRTWSRQILPAGYSFVYRTAEEAEVMMHYVLTHLAEARADVDASAGGSMTDWIRREHNADVFDARMVAMVDKFWPEW